MRWIKVEDDKIVQVKYVPSHTATSKSEAIRDRVGQDAADTLVTESAQKGAPPWRLLEAVEPQHMDRVRWQMRAIDIAWQRHALESEGA